MRATSARATGPRATDLLTVGEIARRSGFTQSAVRYYDALGLLSAIRTLGGQRRFQRGSLRRLALIRAARNMGLSLEEIAAALASLPRERIPGQADWAGLSDSLSKRLDEQIEALEALRDQLTGCIGCGCMSLDNCRAFNPADSASADGPGAAYLPELLRGASPASRQAEHHAPGTVNATCPTWPVCCMRLTGTTWATYLPGGSPKKLTVRGRAVNDRSRATDVLAATPVAPARCTEMRYPTPRPASGQLSVTAPGCGRALTRVTPGTGGQPSG
jgi:MerR family transcriptional regulator, redox-sensitive transcriptional activator SoxR